MVERSSYRYAKSELVLLPPLALAAPRRPSEWIGVIAAPTVMYSAQNVWDLMGGPPLRGRRGRRTLFSPRGRRAIPRPGRWTRRIERSGLPSRPRLGAGTSAALNGRSSKR